MYRLGSIALALALSGCSGVPYWVHDMEGFSPVPMVVHVSQEYLDTACPAKRRGVVKGCAIRWRNPDSCVVLLGPTADACTERHEIDAHCTGWSHDDREIYTADCGPDDLTAVQRTRD